MPSQSWREVRADDYAEPLAGMIRRGEIEPPDEFVIDDSIAAEQDRENDEWAERVRRDGV